MTPTTPAPTTGTWLLLAAAFTPPIIFYWLPTILAVWRRNSRMGLVIFYNLLGILIFPWFSAWVVVLGEHSRRPRKYVPPMWTPPPVEPQGPTPEQEGAILPPPAPAELPPNVTPLRALGESEATRPRRAAREWGRH